MSQCINPWPNQCFGVQYNYNGMLSSWFLLSWYRILCRSLSLSSCGKFWHCTSCPRVHRVVVLLGDMTFLNSDRSHMSYPACWNGSQSWFSLVMENRAGVLLWFGEKHWFYLWVWLLRQGRLQKSHLWNINISVSNSLLSVVSSWTTTVERYQEESNCSKKVSCLAY